MKRIGALKSVRGACGHGTFAAVDQSYVRTAGCHASYPLFHVDWPLLSASSATLVHDLHLMDFRCTRNARKRDRISRQRAHFLATVRYDRAQWLVKRAHSREIDVQQQIEAS